MSKLKLPRFMTPKGKAVYPHLIEPDTKFDPEGVYKVDLSIPADEAAPLVEQLEAIRDEYVEKTLDEAEGKKKAALKKYTVADVFDEEVDDEGRASWMRRTTSSPRTRTSGAAPSCASLARFFPTPWPRPRSSA